MAEKNSTDVEAYKGFARIYDEMMADRDYSRWVDYVSALALDFKIKPPGKILDLACGTGSFLLKMAELGWEIYGTDNSPEMLGVAHEKLLRGNRPFVLLNQDLRESDLRQNFSLITCMCDSLNYLLDPQDVKKTFQRVKKQLAPGGVFIADFNSEYKYRFILGDGSFAETFPNSAYIWENFYDVAKRICRMEIDFFFREDGELFRHICETHLQRAYWQAEIGDLAKSAGFVEINFWEAFTHNPLDPQKEQEILARAEPEDGLNDLENSKYEEGRMFVVMR